MQQHTELPRDLVRERLNTKKYYDRSTVVPSSKFRVRQHVVLQDHQTKEWTVHGQIVAEVAPRSYEVKTINGNILHRNQQSIRRTITISALTPPRYDPLRLFETPCGDPSSDDDSDVSTIPYQEQNSSEEDEMESNERSKSVKESVSKFGRIRKKREPLDYDDL